MDTASPIRTNSDGRLAALLSRFTARVPKRWKSLYVKFCLVYCFLLALTGVLHYFAVIYSWRHLAQNVEQSANWNLAAELAQRLQPLLLEGPDSPALERRLFDLGALNEKVDIYLLDEKGGVIKDFSRHGWLWRQTVDLQPIRAALADFSPELPLLSDDPKRSAEHDEAKAIFSVAKVQIGERPGYLYIVLASRLYTVLMRLKGQYYVLRYALQGLGFTLLLTGGLGILFFSLLSRNFRLLTESVRKFELGDFSSRIEIRSDDEIGALGRAVNDMADTIVANISELEHVDRERRTLIANISHDLRSPLTSMAGFVETLLRKRRSLNDDQVSEYLLRVQRNIEQQRRLVEDLFDLSKLEATDRALNCEEFSIAELAHDLAAKWEIEAERKSIGIEINAAPHLPLVVADIGMITRVLNNLLENALRYTPAGGRVAIDLSSAESLVDISISDTGEGIAADELPFIFESFYRVQRDRSEEIRGSGLGLAIVKRALELHGSEIRVQSELNAGTTFSFSLPRDPIEIPEAECSAVPARTDH